MVDDTTEENVEQTEDEPVPDPNAGNDTNTQDDVPSVVDDYDAYADDLSDESVEALESVQGLVQETLDGGKEVADLGKETRDVLNRLNQGDSFGAARAVIDLFSDDNRQETQEAVDAAKEVMGDLENTRAEGADVVHLLVDAANEIEDEVRQIEIKEQINNLVN